MLPAQAQIEQAREGLAGPSVKLMRTVAQAIKEDLGTVKDALDIFVRTGMQGADKLSPQLDMLKKIGDTLGVLGLDKARGQIQRETQDLAAIVTNGKAPDQNVLEKIAATLLDVEDALDRELVRAVMPGDDAEPAEAAGGVGHAAAASHASRHGRVHGEPREGQGSRHSARRESRRHAPARAGQAAAARHHGRPLDARTRRRP